MTTKQNTKLLNFIVIFLMLIGPVMNGVTSVSAQVKAGSVVEQDGSVSTGTASGASSISFAHTTGTGDNRLMLVGVSWNSGTSAHPITTATFNDGSTNHPLIVEKSETVNATGTVSGPRYAAILSLVAPPNGVAGNVTINFDGTVQYGIVASAVNFRNVDQTTPLGTPVGANGTSSSDPSLSLSSLNGDELIFDTVFLGGNSGTTYTLVANETQDELWNTFNGNTRAAGSIKQSTSSSESMNWVAATRNWWAMVAIPINPATSTSSVVASAIPSDESPTVGDQITVLINIDMSGMLAPDNLLGSFTSTLAWNSEVLGYVSNSGLLAGFTGAINPSTDFITFNGAQATGVGGSINVFTVTFDVIGAGDAELDLSFSAMAAADTMVSIIDFLTINDGSVIAEGLSSDVTVDGAFSSNSVDDVGSISFSHTTGTGDDRLLLVGISWNCGTTDRTISSVQFSYDDTVLGLTEVETQKAPELRYAAIYSLVDTPKNQTGTVTVTFSGSVSNGVVAGAINFKNVDTTDPFETPVGANGTSTSALVSLTGLDGDELIFDTIFQGGSADTQTLTAGSNQTGLWNAFIGNTRASASTEQATGSSAEMSWTATSSTQWAIVAVAINPATLVSPDHTVTFDANGGSGTMTPQVANVPTALIANTFSRSGYTFSGWNIVAGGGGTAYADGATYDFSADITLFAQWVALPSHTVTFNANGGTGTMSPQVANVPTALSANTFTRSGYTFTGWNTAANGSGTAYADGAIYAFSADITLYAQWTALPTHTVTFNANGGTGTMTPQVANVPTELTANAFTRTGYSFTGWNTLAGGGGTAYADGAIYAFSVDITLYAQWDEVIPESVVASAIPSDSTPEVGDTITVTINIDMTNMEEPDNLLGAFTSTLSWNPAILSYVSNSGLLAGYTGAINPASGIIQFNGAKATGIGGSISVLTITFNVIGPGDAALNLAFSNLTSDVPNSILSNLTINQGSVVAEGIAGIVEFVNSSYGIGDGSDTMSFTHTTGTGANLLMLVGISWNSGSAAENIESVVFSYGSTNLALSEVITEQVTVTGTTSGPRFSAIYSLLNPPQGQAGTITITLDDVVSNGIVAGAATFKGVNQTVPLGTPVGAHATASSSSPSVTLSGLSGNELVFDNVFLGGQSDSYDLAEGTNQTERWNDFDTNTRGTASTKQATGSSVTMSWTPTTQNWWSQVAVPINPALGGVTYYNLTIAVNPVGTGTINPAVGTHTYQEGTVVNITTSPNSGFEFDEWSGACSGSGTCQVTMTGNLSVTANYNSVTLPITFTGKELLGQPTNNSISIKIVPDSAISYYYEYGTTSGVYTQQTSTKAASAGTPSTTVITGLTGNTKYFYRMQYSTDGGNSWIARPQLSFYTQRAKGSTFTFDVTTDSHVDILLGDEETWEDTLNDVVKDNPDFLVDLGDTVAIRGLNEGDVTGAENAYKDQLPFFNIVSGSSPIFLVPGNHEQQEAWHLDAVPIGNSLSIIGVNAQKKFFLNPVPDGSFYIGDESTHASIAGDHLKEDYYAWTWGDALFVVISPFWYTETKPYVSDLGGGETDWVGSGDAWDWTLGKVQFDWLKETLEESTASYKFILMHQLVLDGSFPSQEDYGHGGANFAHLVEWGGYNEDGTTWGWDTERPGWGPDPIHQILVNNGVSAVFHAHDHQFAHEELDGIVYESVPSAGFDGSGFGEYVTGEGYTIRALDNPGHLKVTVSPEDTCIAYIHTGATTSTYTHCFEPIGNPPVLDPIGSKAVNEKVNLTFTATATDSDLPAQTLTFSLVDGTAGDVPTGASITTGGAFSWTPSEAQGPGSYTFDVCVSDGTLSDCETITVTVNEVNLKPNLDLIGDKSINEKVELSFSASALDEDLPSQTLTFSLTDGTAGDVPTGASITTGGAFSWTPTEAQGPGSYIFDVCVSDGTLSDCETITVTVHEVNVAPILTAIGNKSVNEVENLTFTATATDSDLPTQTLTFSLADGTAGEVPTGASITTGGIFNWTPTEDQGEAAYMFDVCVSDGTLTDCETIIVTVVQDNVSPVLTPIPNINITENATLSFTATATDLDIPVQPLTFSLENGTTGDVPTGASITTDGEFSWHITEAQGPGTFTFDICVSDGIDNDCQTITVTVAEVNVAPVLNPIGTKEVDAEKLLTFTATASDADLPVQTLTFSLADGTAGDVPTGASITTGGIFSWTPTEDQSPATYTFDICVSDGTLSDCETITVKVNKIFDIITNYIFLPLVTKN